MATIQHTSDHLGQGVSEYTWTPLADEDDGTWIEIGAYADKTVQFSGTFSGGTLTLEGSNDKASAFVLTDPDGTALSFVAAALRSVRENPRYIRPHATGGEGTSITCIIFAKRVT